MKRLCIRLLSVFLVLLAAASLSADTLILRDGRRIEGQLISVRNGIVEFEEGGLFSGGGRLERFDRDAILGIEFNRNDRNASRNFPPYPSGDRRQSGLRERQVIVPANVPWVDTNIDVQPGQEVYFEASGEVGWGPGRRDNAAGEVNSPMNPHRPIPSRPAAALIGRVGDGSMDYFYIGLNRSAIRMRAPGRLLLGINDDVLQDNSGSFRVVVRY